MERIAMFFIESLAVSAALCLLYLLLFRGKASFLAQRLLLLSIPLVATISALISFDFIAVPVAVDVDAVEQILESNTPAYGDEMEPLPIEKGEFRIIRSERGGLSIMDIAVRVWGGSCDLAAALCGEAAPSAIAAQGCHLGVRLRLLDLLAMEWRDDLLSVA